MTKTALITGASGGIGRAVAKRLATDGFALALAYSGNPAKVDEVLQELAAGGAQATALQADVSDPESVQALFASAAAKLGRLDVVVHTAGTMELSPVAKGDVALFDRTIATNLRGSFLVLAQAAQHVAAGGRIIAFSSSVIAKAMPTYGAYIAAKAGVEGLVRVLANELRGRQVTVNAVAPGPVATLLFTKGKTPEQIEQTAKMAPLERLGEPDDIQRVVSFLAGLDGGWVNGQVLRANGGFA